jgi:BirA family biotin operon repressor/biotin-[acetyl-CoA-carboxylase] ligase
VKPTGLTEEGIRPHLPRGRVAWIVHTYGSVGSTNDVARRLARGGAPEGTLVLAETQTGGRGRRGTRWQSPPGGLWLSIVLRPHLPADRAGGLSVVAAIAVARAVRSDARLDARIKWPNDVYVGGRKLAGAMVESVGAGTLVLGIGINVNVRATELPQTEWYETTSLLVELGREVDRPRFLGLVLEAFEAGYFRFRGPAHDVFTDEWRALSTVLGERVCIRVGDRVLNGTVFGLDEDGGIVLRLPDGRQEKVMPSGDVTATLIRE